MTLSSVIQNHHVALTMIALNGADIWDASQHQALIRFRNSFLHEFAALPTNTQFVERGVKESGFVSLGSRGETNRSILAIARSCLVSNSLQ